MSKDTAPRKISSRASVRHSYESVLSASARLYLLATGQAPEGDGPIEARQDVLAHEDLTAFAIHARRLIESTISTTVAADVTVEGMYEGKKCTVPMTRILNTVIHHKDRVLFNLGAAAREPSSKELEVTSPGVSA